MVKVADLGLAGPANEMLGHTLAGTPVYMAPEVLLRSGRYDTKVDVYRSVRQHIHSLSLSLW